MFYVNEENEIILWIGEEKQNLAGPFNSKEEAINYTNNEISFNTEEPNLFYGCR